MFERTLIYRKNVAKSKNQLKGSKNQLNHGKIQQKHTKIMQIYFNIFFYNTAK